MEGYPPCNMGTFAAVSACNSAAVNIFVTHCLYKLQELHSEICGSWRHPFTLPVMHIESRDKALNVEEIRFLICQNYGYINYGLADKDRRMTALALSTRLFLGPAMSVLWETASLGSLLRLIPCFRVPVRSRGPRSDDQIVRLFHPSSKTSSL